MLAPIVGAMRPAVEHSRSTQFVRVNHCAALFGVSVQTIRNYADNPANGVEVRRTPGNHRLVDLGALAELFGFDVGQADESESRASAEEIRQGKISVLYSRVSTRSQCVDKNLDRQAERLKAYVEANHPDESATCLQVSEQASGINSERKGLTKIIDLALAGRLGTLFIETEDRLSRGSYALIARLLHKCGVEIVVTRTGERESTAKTAEEEIFHDAMAMIYVGQSRLYGKRASLGKRFIASQSLRDRIAGLYSQGIPAGKLFESIRREQHVCQSTGKPLTVRIVWKITQEIEKAAPSKMIPDAVRRFVKEACEVRPTATVLTKEIWTAFTRFCDQHGLPRVSRNKLPAFLRSAVPTVKTRLASHHSNGLEMVGLSLT